MTGSSRTYNRRRYLKQSAVVGGALLAGCSGGGGGGDGEFPNQQITKIIPYEPGGGTDTFLRQIGQHFPDYLGVNAKYENVPGANGLRGITQCYNAEPDGHTLVGVNPPAEVLPVLIDPDATGQMDITDLEPVAHFAFSAISLVANAGEGVEDFEDLKQRYNSGEFSRIGGAAAGGTSHIIALIMRDEFGVEWDDYIAYDGSAPTVEAVSSGEIPAGIPTSGVAEPSVEEGLVDPIVSFRSGGDEIFEDLPTITDIGYDNIDYVGAVTRGYLAPPDTPQDRLDTLTEGVREILQSDEIQSWADETGQAIEFGDQDAMENVWHGGFERIPEKVDLESIREQT